MTDRATRSPAQAAIELRQLLETFEQEGTSVVERLCGHEVPEPWVIYPGEYGVFDRSTRSQFYYHRHENADHEAGHFHTVRLFPDRVAHLVAISMAPDGWPTALFTVNLWAVGDAEESLPNLKNYVRRFRIEDQRAEADMSRAGGGGSRPLIAPLIRFVNLAFEAFRPEIETLQEEKARTIEEYRRSHGGADPFEDRSLETLSRTAIDLRA
ncbi:MAG: hypothetical protein HYU41_14655 [Candidatus Rokubacteria bacterium]|nr:hypothetical protein [Candidatus Rokubacteria bacterium]